MREIIDLYDRATRNLLIAAALFLVSAAVWLVLGAVA